jgi:hypothetical protein
MVTAGPAGFATGVVMVVAMLLLLLLLHSLCHS